MGSTITNIRAREILDCRGLPTVHVELELDSKIIGGADVPAGRSTGVNEALDLRDGGTRFGGYGVLTAIGNVNTIIHDRFVGTELTSQRAFDDALIALDGTANKAKLGANATTGVSLAAARAAASMAGLSLYRWLSATSTWLPVPQVNLINGGRHASNDLDFQEFTIMPIGAKSFSHAIQIASEVNLHLAEILLPELGKSALNTGDEGGYAPAIQDPEVALAYLHRAVDAAGYSDLCGYGLDCAASHFYDSDDDTYRLSGQTLNTAELIAYYEMLIADYDVVSIEDPLHEEDFAGFAEMTARTDIQIVGDDLFVTNEQRVKKGAAEGAGNSLLWKFNQVGTLSEAFDAADAAAEAGMSVVVSERSGETEDPIIADLVVGMSAGQIKTGAPVRGERTAKYNRLLEIEAKMGGTAQYAGREYRSSPGQGT